MTEIVERVAKAIEEACPRISGGYVDFSGLARAAIAELVIILNVTNNSSLNLTADELQAELDEDAAELSK